MQSNPLEFSNLLAIWASYSNLLAKVLPADDERHDLASEIAVRLEQMETCIRLVREWMNTIAPSHTFLEQVTTYMELNASKLASGEISEDQYTANIPDEKRDPRSLAIAFSNIRLFTESFYAVAWRVREIVNSCRPYKLPGLSRIKGTGIRDVRNHLIQHPEKSKMMRPFRQSMIITDDGPVLKSSSTLIKAGRTAADIDSLDKGLFVNAAVFLEEFKCSLENALKEQSLTSQNETAMRTA